MRLIEIFSLGKLYTYNALVESCPLINKASSSIWTSEAAKRLHFPRIEGEINFIILSFKSIDKNCLLLSYFAAEMVLIRWYIPGLSLSGFVSSFFFNVGSLLWLNHLNIYIFTTV